MGGASGGGGLADSPMFRARTEELERGAAVLQARGAGLLAAAERYQASLAAQKVAQLDFAQALRTFCAEGSGWAGEGALEQHAEIFADLAECQELLHSQFEHVACQPLHRLLKDKNQAVQEQHRRMERRLGEYDQTRRKYLALQRGADRADVEERLREQLEAARLGYDSERFELRRQLHEVRSAGRYEFLYSLGGAMDAHVRYFAQGVQVLGKLDCSIQAALELADQRKARGLEEMEAWKAGVRAYSDVQARDSEARASASQDGVGASGNGAGPVQMTSVQSERAQEIEALIRAAEASDAAPEALHQGYLLKRSSNMIGNWKRRYFVLDSGGTLSYVSGAKGGSAKETVGLTTSTLKMDVDDSALRFCFRIVSPDKTYTLQAENEQDRSEWMGAIQGAIASLLNKLSETAEDGEGPGRARSSGNSLAGLGTSSPAKKGCPADANGSSEDQSPLHILRALPGNAVCADCGGKLPEWASLNLAVLLCIECSGIHRRLGVHVSKVRSLTLDVKVWGPSILRLFQATGNAFVNGLWEGELQEGGKSDDSDIWDAKDDAPRARGLSLFREASRGAAAKPLDSEGFPSKKPRAESSLTEKEKYITMKYVQRAFVPVQKVPEGAPGWQEVLWEAAERGQARDAMRALICGADAQATCVTGRAAALVRDMSTRAQAAAETASGRVTAHPRLELSMWNGAGLSALHFAAAAGDLAVLELLALWGAPLDQHDPFYRTALHYCILTQWDAGAKLLLHKGASAKATDMLRQSALEMAMGRGNIADEELFVLLAENT